MVARRMNGPVRGARRTALLCVAFFVVGPLSSLHASPDCCVKEIPAHKRYVWKTVATPCDNSISGEPIYKTVKKPIWKTRRVKQYRTEMVPTFEPREVPDWKTVTRPRTRVVEKPLVAKRIESQYLDTKVPQTKIVNEPRYEWCDVPVYGDKWINTTTTIKVPVKRTRRVKCFEKNCVPRFETERTPEYAYREIPLYDYIRVPVCKTCTHPVLGTQEIREKYLNDCGCEECESVSHKTVKICECKKKEHAGWIEKRVQVGTKRERYLKRHNERKIQVGTSERQVHSGYKLESYISMEPKEVPGPMKKKRVIIGYNKEKRFMGYTPHRQHAGFLSDKLFIGHKVTARPMDDTLVSECEGCQQERVYNGTKTIKVRVGEREKKIACGWKTERFLAGYRTIKEVVGHRTFKTPTCPGTKRVQKAVSVPCRKVTVVKNGSAYATPLPGTTEIMTQAQYAAAMAVAISAGGLNQAVSNK